MQKQFLAAVVASVVAGQAMAVTVVDDGTNKFSVGGHIGMRYEHEKRGPEEGNGQGAGDSSRFNFQFESKLNEDVTAFARGEWGFDVTRHDNQQFSNRLGFAGVKGDFGTITAGKQWGAYSKVANWTDAFATEGGDASGLYGPSGHYNGTARANEAIQYDISVNGLNVAAQYQFSGGKGDDTVHNDFGVADWSGTRTRDYGFGLAVSYDLPMGLSFGGAYNQVKYVEDGQNDAKAMILGAKFDQGPVYAAFTFGEYKNHAAMDVNVIEGTSHERKQQTFEKARGYELYASYQLTENFKVEGGYNQLDDKTDQTENTKLKYMPVGLVYTAGPVQLSGTYTYEKSKFNNIEVKDRFVAQARYYF